MKYKFYSDCTDWRRSDVDAKGGLCDMVDNAIQVSRQTFLKHVSRSDLHEIEAALGYESNPQKGETMAGDYHVSYHRSKLHGKRVYYFQHSAIEYVFTRRGDR